MEIVADWIMKPIPSIPSKFVVEIIACTMFHFIGSISPTPWANGIALMVLVYFTAKTSGAHLNPALSLSFTLLGYTNPFEMLVFWAAQVIGCIFGALWVAALVPNLDVGASISRLGDGPFYDGCFVPRSDLAPINVFCWEAVCTFSFLVPIFTVVWYTYRKNGYGNSGPILIGLSLLAHAFAAGPFTGAAFNPARVLGSYFVFDCGNANYVGSYIGGEMLAGFLVPFAVVPWYGICPDSWFLVLLPERVIGYMKNLQQSICVDYESSNAQIVIDGV